MDRAVGQVATADPASGTVRLVQSGVHEVGKKLVEEAAEAWMAAEHESAERAAEELSQLLLPRAGDDARGRR